MFKRRTAILLAFLGGSGVTLQAVPSPAEYANDLGPSTIDVSGYPTDMQEAYKVFQMKCGICHTAARAVNSEFVGGKEWSHYVKRMALRPPCCSKCPYISMKDARTIYQFLVYDSQVRKTGARAKVWARQRQALLDAFKKKYPKKYAEHYAAQKETQ